MQINQKMFEDEYCVTFGPGEFQELKAKQQELDGLTSWESVTTPMEVTATGDPIFAMEIAMKHGRPDKQAVYTDTAMNSGLMLRFNGNEVCVRSCAVSSLLSTCAVYGSGFGRLDKEDLASVLTTLLKPARELSTVMTRADKVTAIVSGSYVQMPIMELLDVCEGLEDSFGNMEFKGGLISHDMTICNMEFPDAAPQITNAYQSAFANSGRKTTSCTVVPRLQLRTSDAANEAAKIMTYLKMNGLEIPIGGFSVPHVTPQEYHSDGTRLTCMEKFIRETGTLFAKMNNDIADLIPRMLNTPIEYPGNTFVGLAKYAGIPQKWGGLVEEELRSDWPDHSGCTMLDIYEALCECTAKAVQAGYTPHSKRVLDLEEGISKVAKNHSKWTAYDLPGTVAWTQKASQLN